MSNLTRAIGAALREALRRRGIRQEGAAATLGLSQAAISRRLAGEVPWRIEELEALAELLGIPLAELLQPVADDEPEAVAS